MLLAGTDRRVQIYYTWVELLSLSLFNCEY